MDQHFAEANREIDKMSQRSFKECRRISESLTLQVWGNDLTNADVYNLKPRDPTHTINFVEREPTYHRVKHHFSSSIVSWVEDSSSMAGITHFTDTTFKDDDHSHSSSYLSRNLPDMHISARLIDEFRELAKENTSNNLETCGILGASLKDGTYYVTTLVVPKQEATAHSCQASNEEEIHAILAEQSLLPAGWIHTHPSQTCFLSSIDLHTQYSYQVMLPEAVAIVIAPTDQTRPYGIFRLTNPGGMAVLRDCKETGFHQHPEAPDGSSIYESCSNVYSQPNLRFEVIDLRPS